MPDLTKFMAENPDAIYLNALSIMPQVESRNLLVTKNEFQLKETKGGLYPTLNAYAGYGTSAFFIAVITSYSIHYTKLYES